MGWKLSAETIQKREETKRQKRLLDPTYSKSDRHGKNNTFYGKHHKPESIEKALKTRGNKLVGPGNGMFGRGHKEDAKKKISQYAVKSKRWVGKNNPNYKDGKCAERSRRPDMGKAPYKQWRKAVFERDHYTCVMCG